MSDASRAAPDLPCSSPSSSGGDLTSCVYRTPFGLVSMTWCRGLAGRTLRIDLNFQSDASASFRLRLRPWLFWKKRGSKKFQFSHAGRGSTAHLSWDLSCAEFRSSGPEPSSSFYIAVAVDRQMVLLVGDYIQQAYARTKAQKPLVVPESALVMRQDRALIGKRSYCSNVAFGGKTHGISIDFSPGADGGARLAFGVDGERVLLVRHLRWKFRGSERFEIDGVPVKVSWDVHQWLFGSAGGGGPAIFLLRFEEGNCLGGAEGGGDSKEMVLCHPLWLQQEKSPRKSFLTMASSSSSSSISSCGSSSVMEWSSVEENELQSSPGFSLLIYAWKR